MSCKVRFAGLYRIFGVMRDWCPAIDWPSSSIFAPRHRSLKQEGPMDTTNALDAQGSPLYTEHEAVDKQLLRRGKE